MLLISRNFSSWRLNYEIWGHSRTKRHLRERRVLRIWIYCTFLHWKPYRFLQKWKLGVKKSKILCCNIFCKTKTPLLRKFLRKFEFNGTLNLLKLSKTTTSSLFMIQHSTLFLKQNEKLVNLLIEVLSFRSIHFNSFDNDFKNIINWN